MNSDQFETGIPAPQGLYDFEQERDACGVGLVADLKNEPSHKIIEMGITVLKRLMHRGAVGSDPDTGDGAGILLALPDEFFRLALPNKLPARGKYGVAMMFGGCGHEEELEDAVTENGGSVIAWRQVPVDRDSIGKNAQRTCPLIRQLFIDGSGFADQAEFERKLFVMRREMERRVEGCYVCSCSSRSIVYKGLFLGTQIEGFYGDLASEHFKSPLALVHQRYSTNTFPTWSLAHPFRYLAHNGEINTIRGNADRMLAREETMRSPVWEGDMDKVFPVVDVNGSDSAMLDNTLEFLVMSGMELPLAVMVCLPEPWRNNETLSRARRDLYQYYAVMMEPWDGPAAILFSDGEQVGAVLDRNGLRPARYYVTDDGRLILSSEVGVLDLDPAHIVKKSRLEPGKLLLVDTRQGRIVGDDELKEAYAARGPYGEWLDRNLIQLKDLPIPNRRVETYSPERRAQVQKAFGYTWEDLKDVILPMARTGAEPTAAMGADIPLAVLSQRGRPLFDYFRQLFAQVTNPPIDAIREEIVTDTTVYVGDDGNLLEERAENCRVLQIHNPILTSVDLLKIKAMNRPGFHVETISLLYFKHMPLKRALDQMKIAADRAYRQGANIIILSDRGVDENHAAIPSLLAVSALEQHLIRTRKRTAVSVILESAEPRDVHHFAALLGYGARAVNPYLAQETVGQLIGEGLLDKDLGAAVDDYDRAILKGIVKIASKMGISTLQSYQSAQIFEAVGIARDVVDEYFTNTVSRVGGVGLKEIEAMVDRNHTKAFDPLGLATDPALDSSGLHKARAGGEDHMYSPQVIHLLQEAARRGDYGLFKQYSALVDDENSPHTLRGLMEMRYAETPIPIDEVEGVDSIVKRFKTGAMSYGSISQEAHECMARAMNLLGGKSNSGEGGERPERLHSDRCSAIKQVASGRFGVTSQYLVSAKEIQIKMAQGAKPGEGGHLPGKKVYPWIAKTRYSTPGVALISPPPHHDIYSIEDLAQLIFDLKNANRQARISVKLVSEAGVGTVAAGVAKAGAQVILISGWDGGTGAAPRTSIHHAGLPWELGLAETHQTLIQNGLRSRVALETDGKLMTGRDVAIACMLGAEEFGFATAPLVTMGCVMMRVCNLDTCPVGVATQNPELRKRFRGRPEYVVNFMRFVAQELREHMAKLGVRTVDGLVGRTDLLRQREKAVNDRAATVDLSAILDNPYLGDGYKTRFDPADVYDFKLEDTVDWSVLLPRLGGALGKGGKKEIALPVTSTDRAVGTMFGSEITRLYGEGLAEDSFTVRCTGGGGQSFGAFIPQGLTLTLEGDANDYFGKGLSGGKLAVFPPKGSAFRADENIIIGNVALYGATSGKAFIAGRAGERFAVRNSGASAVVEGVGDHGCEYMTGGRVVVLGETGKNFAAGMSGGVAYVWDPRRDLYRRGNKELVSLEPVESKRDLEELRSLIAQHAAATGSEKGRAILEDFEHAAASFKKILPRDYDRMLKAIAQREERGLGRDEAELEAFYAATGGDR